MNFRCLCTDPNCYCFVEVWLTVEEQDEIILARIMGDAIYHDLQANKVCEQCLGGWHLLDADSEKRTKKEDEIDETDQSSQEPATAEAGAEPN